MIGEPRGGASHSLGEWVLCEHRGDALLPRHRAPPGRCSKVMPPLTPAHLSCRFQLTYHPGLYPVSCQLTSRLWARATGCDPNARSPTTESSADGRLYDPTVEIQVFRRGLLPAEVAGHRLAHHVAPAFGVLVLIDRTHRGAHEIGGFVVVEEKAGDVVFDGIGETADTARDGERAVALGAHLGETARLVLRRHEAHVRAGEQLVLELLREAQLHRDSTRRARCNGGER